MLPIVNEKWYYWSVRTTPFWALGGTINFVKDGSKVAFELNLTAAKAAELKVAPKLQGIAKSVEGG